jgi:hypothetical protein
MLAAPPMFVAAGILGAGLFAPIPAGAATVSKSNPVSYLDTDGHVVHCTLIQRINKDSGAAPGVAFAETEISGPDPQCFGAEVCHSAVWTDPFGNPDGSIESCSNQEHSVWYAPVDPSEGFRLTSSVHFSGCSFGCDRTFTFSK